MIIDNNVEKYILQEVDSLANIVRSTLGPCGASVIIGDSRNTKITKDGVSVARAIKATTKSQVVNIIQQIAEKTGNEAGDGTTSSTVFAQALLHSLYENKECTTNLFDIKNRLDKYKKQAIDLLRTYVNTEYNLYDVANISCNGNTDIAQSVVDILSKTGQLGVVTFKESETSETYVQYTEGLKWEAGYLSPTFITNNKRAECEFINARIEVYPDKLSSLTPIIKTMDICKANNIPLLLIVKDIEYDVLNTIVFNQINHNLKVCVVKIPGHSAYRNDNIKDLQAVIGTSELIDKVIISKHNTLFINNKDNTESKSERLALLNHRLTLHDENLADLRTRITNINNAFATVYVGGDSPIEIQERMDRFEDAVCASKSAMEEGVVIGGGNCLRTIGDNLIPIDSPTDIALIAMKRACYSIIEQIHANYNGLSNYKYGTLTIPSDIIGFKNGSLTTILEPIKEGLIDAAKVIRLVIENGVSVVGTLITTKSLIINDYE